jgi:hypothetical protein
MLAKCLTDHSRKLRITRIENRREVKAEETSSLRGIEAEEIDQMATEVVVIDLKAIADVETGSNRMKVIEVEVRIKDNSALIGKIKIYRNLLTRDLKLVIDKTRGKAINVEVAEDKDKTKGSSKTKEARAVVVEKVSTEAITRKNLLIRTKPTQLLIL